MTRYTPSWQRYTPSWQRYTWLKLMKKSWCCPGLQIPQISQVEYQRDVLDQQVLNKNKILLWLMSDVKQHCFFLSLCVKLSRLFPHPYYTTTALRMCVHINIMNDSWSIVNTTLNIKLTFYITVVICSCFHCPFITIFSLWENNEGCHYERGQECPVILLSIVLKTTVLESGEKLQTWVDVRKLQICLNKSLFVCVHQWEWKSTTWGCLCKHWLLEVNQLMLWVVIWRQRSRTLCSL